MENMNFGIQATETLELESSLAEFLGGDTEMTAVTPEEKKAPLAKNVPPVTPPEEEKKTEPDEKELEQSLLAQLSNPTPNAKEPEGKQEPEEDEVSAQAIADNFYDLGILTGDKQKVESQADVLRLMQEEKTRGAEEILTNFLSQKGDKYEKAFDAIFVKGVDPEDYFSIDKNVESVKGVDMEDINIQREMVRRSFKDMNKKPEWIERYIKNIEESGDLDTEALSAQEQLINKEEKELQRKIELKEKEQKYKEQEAAAYDSTVRSKIGETLKANDLKGFPFTQKYADGVYDFISTKKWRLDATGEVISDFDKSLLELRQPQNAEKAIMVAYLMQNDFDFSKIKAKAITEKNDRLFNTVVKKEKEAKRENSFHYGFKING